MADFVWKIYNEKQNAKKKYVKLYKSGYINQYTKYF